MTKARLSRSNELSIRIDRTMRLAKAYADGEDVCELVRVYGVSRATVIRAAAKYGCLRGKLPRRFDHAAILSAYLAQEPIAAIAARFGCSISLVSTIATKAGCNRHAFHKRGEACQPSGVSSDTA